MDELWTHQQPTKIHTNQNQHSGQPSAVGHHFLHTRGGKLEVSPVSHHVSFHGDQLPIKIELIIYYSSSNLINWTCGRVRSKWRHEASGDVAVKMERSSGTDESVMRGRSADSPDGNVLHLSAAPQESNLIKDDGWRRKEEELQEPWELMDVQVWPTFPCLSTGLRKPPFC